MRFRLWPLTALCLTLACGRTGLGTAQPAPAGTHTPGVADASASLADTGGAADTSSGPCGEARCLSSLFQACVPAGNCHVQGAGGPSAVASDTCYTNGITVSYVGGWNGTNVTTTLSVSRRGDRCYTIKSTSGTTSSATTYVISGPSGEVATAETADKAGSLSVTCQGQKPVLVSSACLSPVSIGTDDCVLDACP